MDSQDAEHWERKAERARDAARRVSGENAKAILLEIANYYAALAHEARTVDAAPPLVASEAN